MGHPAAAARRVLLLPGHVWKKPPAPETALRGLVERAAAHVRPASLLLVLDQFEEFIIMHEPEEQEEFSVFLRSLATQPVSGFKVLLVLRSDYLGRLDKMGLPPLEQHVNWEEVPAFTERDALHFIEDSGLQIAPALKERLFSEARDVEDTPGLIKPITLNLFGMILQRSPERLPASYERGSVLTPRGSPQNRPMRITSKPANGTESGQAHLYLVRTASDNGFSTAGMTGHILTNTWAEDRAPQGCDPSADPEAGMAGRRPSRPPGF